MNIGLTYDLKSQYLKQGFSKDDVAELDSEDTINAIDSALKQLGHKTTHIGNIQQLISQLENNKTWDLVFNIAEGIHGSAREAQIPGILEAYNIPTTFGNALCLALCLDKPTTKHILKGHNIPTPNFTVIKNTNVNWENINLNYPLFAKPAAEGSGLGVSTTGLVHNPNELQNTCTQLLKTHRQPVLVEEYLPGNEFTVGIVGTGKHARSLGVMEVLLLDNAEPNVYSYENKNQYQNRIKYQLAPNNNQTKQAEKIALESYKILNCQDAGRADIRCDKHGNPQFIEINPLAGLNPNDSDLPILCRLQNIPYNTLITKIITSATQRITPNKKK